MAEKKSFVMYTEYKEYFGLLSEVEQGQLLMAIFAYVDNGELPNFAGALQMAFTFIKNQIDKDAEKWADTIEKRKEAGKMGGAPKGNSNASKQAKQANGCFDNQKQAKQAKQADNVNVNVNDLKEKDNTNVLSKKKNFEPPTLEEVTEYINSNNYHVNPEQFIDYYQARGWYLTKNRRVTDWKACVRTWVRNGYDTAKAETKPKESEFDRFMRELAEA